MNNDFQRGERNGEWRMKKMMNEEEKILYYIRFFLPSFYLFMS